MNESFNKELESNEGEGEILAHNLRMLNNDLMNFLSTESMGGNAGKVNIDGKDYPCSGARGYIDGKTSKIVCFGNFQDLDKEIVENNLEFILKVATIFEPGVPAKAVIVDSSPIGQLSATNLEAITNAISEFNKQNN